ncbi:ATP-dependent helicase [Mycolicibacterium brumae]|uniref:DNA 3'-5' helicase n=1 Tax=Mycolicibacterium brumae TaxID=85968 RepID=A0A2G5PDD1_9MYCO|nr:ATP-dependent DNA helicase [Mycolicibacterium brumae]MCV7193174.1 ATP-dependent helicase [Mycolicibacterium brumae]PIB75914.1 ATP-dependent helicase [Mycolicibacterium brumae]RWA16612.1 hypothetical protein MBRU_07765 [Mycolicibacterium brumae DSM 44177]UWW09829.1 ATP-dependent helicase [Mycolicibacterium brumae]
MNRTRTDLSPAELADILGLHTPTDEQAAVIAAPPGPLVVIAGAGAGKTETMAARVVWLVANGYATPGQVLGLTFTRKAAGQLSRRVRSRLAKLGSAGLLPPSTVETEQPAVSTYHAFAGNLLSEFGLLLPVEPDARLIGATEMWQLAYDVIARHPGELDTTRTPAAVTGLVLGLAGDLAEHLVDTDAVRHTHAELGRLVTTLPPGPRQRAEPSKDLLAMLDVQIERAGLVPLIDAVEQRMRDAKVMDFGAQMSAAARLAQQQSEVGAQLRARYRVVLLDEYQDTGHAQRVLLSELFGHGVDDTLALTAVGDPIQSIYGWRGASATNLPRFATDFQLSDGAEAPMLELRTSWRNPPSTLTLANAVSEPARRRSVEVGELLPRPDAEPGEVKIALCGDIVAERDWLADQIARRWADAVDAAAEPPTAAVLVRRNADSGPIADALRARGVPVEVVGLAGLLAIDEVADLVAMLRLVADPAAGSAALRVLTGPRWRLGAADLAALWRRARDLQGPAGGGDPAHIAAGLAPDADHPALADAICEPGPADAYSESGHRRIAELAAELSALRAQLHHPLPDLVAAVRATLRSDVEVIAAGRGTEQLDAFADVVDGYAARVSSRDADPVLGLLGYLDAAMTVEGGLAPAEPVTAAAGRVQILTVHAAKGLEWQLVAVPHLSGGVFPSSTAGGTWLTSPGQLPPVLRGDRVTLGEHGVPVLDTSEVTNRKQLSDTITAHKAALAQRRDDEERRLLYVALTRAEDTLLLSGHHWGETGLKPRGPSPFLTELADIARANGCGQVDVWSPAPAVGTPNPLQQNIIEAMWPDDPLGGGRTSVQRGAELVRAAMAAAGDPANVTNATDDDPWAAEVDALLAERAREPEQRRDTLPGQLSVSNLVELGRDPDNAAARLRRRLPSPPDSNTLLGTAFHEWVQRYYRADRLFDLEDLPGAVDAPPVDPDQLALLQTAFNSSRWANRTPVELEVPFEMAIGEKVVRGRIDAVFADGDGFTVLDWKTGSPPKDAESLAHNAIQLAVYRIAWAALAGCEPERVNAAFHYVRTGATVYPESLPGADDLDGLLSPASTPGTPR